MKFIVVLSPYWNDLTLIAKGPLWRHDILTEPKVEESPSIFPFKADSHMQCLKCRPYGHYSTYLNVLFRNKCNFKVREVMLEVYGKNC